MKTYRSYKNLPSLAGLRTMSEAMKPGFSIEECVARLKRYHYALKRLHQIFNNRITAEPIYELKMGFSLHAHYCAEHVAALRTRVGEMREPPLGLEAVPHPALEIFFDEILSAPTTEELLLGLYSKALPALKSALERHLGDTNKLVDHPTVRLCRFALLELQDLMDFGEKAIAQLVTAEQLAKAKNWLQFLNDCLAAAGALHGADNPVAKDLSRQDSAKPFKYDAVPKRD